MGNNTKQIQTLDALERELFRQRLKAKTLESKLDENFNYLQDNYSTLVKNSIFRSGEGENMVSSIIRSLVGHERLQEALVKLANPLADKAAGWIDSLIGRMNKKEPE
jgi:hypothetical protein